MLHARIASLALVLSVTSASALFLPPDGRVPLSRLISNLEGQLVEAPDDPHLHARLGRAHSMAYALGEMEVDVQGKGENPKYALYERGNEYPLGRRSLDGAAIVARIGHLHQAVAHYQKASRLGPDEPYIWLGLGYAYDEMAHAAAWLANPTGTGGALKDASDAVLRAWEDLAVAAYARAMGEQPELSRGFVTPPVELEAAHYIRLILEPRVERTREEKKLIKTAKGLAGDAARLPRMVTPIIFSLDAAQPLHHLLADGVSVRFDLDGAGRNLAWPWVKPDTAFLVWDAEGRGEVRSGRQLIGSVTWWLFWEDGYAVLRALDDDRDGWLAGSELDGLAVWQDANSNGVSDAGEVQPLEAAGVRRIGTGSTGHVDGMPMNTAGLEMNDGRLLPTYDWITGPVEQ